MLVVLNLQKNRFDEKEHPRQKNVPKSEHTVAESEEVELRALGAFNQP
jgi:hypothetical protein